MATLAGCAWLRQWEERRPPYHSVTPGVAFDMLRDNPALPILDLRTEEEFHGALGHLHRAFHLPLSELPGRLGEISVLRDRTFLVYCREEGECGREGMAILVSSGFDDAIFMDGGIERWVQAGFRTVGAREAAESEAEGEPGA